MKIGSSPQPVSIIAGREEDRSYLYVWGRIEFPRPRAHRHDPLPVRHIRPDDEDDDTQRIWASISSIVHLRDGGDPDCISPDAKGSAYRPTIMPVSEEIIRAEFETYEAEATRLVKQHWCAIERVAKAIEQRDLDQAELDRLL